ncbi:endonuclease [Candidatus Woesearchaeota archaeon]|nr:endonuclease [Candidatus Woesearchaeota archaeon]
MNKLRLIYNILLKEYGEQGWWPLGGIYNTKNKLSNLDDKSKFEICLGAILTQNTSWKNVEISLNNLRKNNCLNINKLRDLSIEELAFLIKSSGYNNQKAKKVKEFIKFLDSGKEVSRDNLLSVWGIGNETVDSILLYAHKKPYFVVDAYTKRIFSRIGLCKENVDYIELQKLFHDNLEENSEFFNEYHALLVEHAKRYCKKKPSCNGCPLKNECKYYKENSS